MQTIVRIKARDDWELDVLGVPYGGPDNGRDADGEYFDNATKLHDDKFPLPPAVYYHGFSEDGNPSGSPEYIGKTVSFTDKPDGRWYRVVLDKANELAGRVWEAAKQGIARASSGSISHLARVGNDGHILEWPVAELSLFDAIGNRQPANAYAVALPVLKMRTDLEALLQEAGGTPATEDATVTVEIEEEVLTHNEVNKMAENEQEKAPAVDLNPILDAIKGIGAKVEAVDTAVKAFDTRLEKVENKPDNDPGPASVVKSVNVNDKFGDISKYDNYSPEELAATAAFVGSSTGNQVSPALYKAIAARLESEEATKRAFTREARQYMKSRGIKADETNFSTNASYGDEWIGVVYSGDLWEKIRVNTFVVDKLNPMTAPPGAESIVWPLEGTDPVWYTVAQAGDPSSATAQVTNTVPAKALGTGKVTATLGKLGTSVIYTGEMDEDSVLPFASTLSSRLAISGAEYLESAIIDGDTESGATTNINDIAGTPAATDWFMVWNGFRKSPLITTTANSRDGGTLASTDYIETVKLMGAAGINAMDMAKVSFIIDPLTHYKSLELTDVKTRDVYNGATIENGRLTRIYGYNIDVSTNICKAATNRLSNGSGLVDVDTQSNNTKGSILAVRWDQWRFGYRRTMTIESERIPRADAWEITALMRATLSQRDTEASAISYNLTV
jgi:uncharacterized protein YoxC